VVDENGRFHDREFVTAMAKIGPQAVLRAALAATRRTTYNAASTRQPSAKRRSRTRMRDAHM
jgi:hypothetical protein